MIKILQKPAILTLKINLLCGLNNDFASWQSKLNSQIVSYPGFISLEFLSPTNEKNKWIVVQRFGSFNEISNWKNSVNYQQLIDEVKNLSINGSLEEIITDESTLKGGVTQVIIAEVNEKEEKAYRDWMAKIHHTEAKFPGFCGVYIQSPNESKGKFWITLLQFDTMENLDFWIHSSERNALLEEAKPLINYIETHRVVSPYAGWFASIAKLGNLPALWKQTMIVLLVLFPIVMLEYKFLSPLTNGLNLSLRTFIGNAISVSLISFPMMPIAIYFLGWWLSPTQKIKKIGNSFAGCLVVLILYLLEIWTFWNFR